MRNHQLFSLNRCCTSVFPRGKSSACDLSLDIPLADQVLTKGGCALSLRGKLITKENTKAKLNIRDFMDTLRSSGIQTGGPPSLGHADRKAFADHLD